MYVSGRIADFDVPRPSFGRCYSTVYDRNDVRLFAWSMGPTVDDVPSVIREDSDLVQLSTIHTPMSCKAFIHIHRTVYLSYVEAHVEYFPFINELFFVLCSVVFLWRWLWGLNYRTLDLRHLSGQKNGLLFVPRFPYSDFYNFILVSSQYDSA